jgi:F-type H+-transporting ATPase subunit b
MPQLQPHDFAPQLFWLAVIFTLFYLALAYRVIPRIEHVIGARKAKIEGDLKGAREAQQLADRAAANYDAEVAAAKAKGQASIRAHRGKLEAELGAKREEFERQLMEKAAATEKAVQGLIERAAGEMEAMTKDAVAGIVKELADVEVSDDEVRAALRQHVKE